MAPALSLGIARNGDRMLQAKATGGGKVAALLLLGYVVSNGTTELCHAVAIRFRFAFGDTGQS